MKPKDVFEALTSLITFHQLVGHEIYPGYFEYQIIFKCNEEAVHARRDLLRTITKFGRNAVVVWDSPTNNENNYRYNSSQRNEMLQQNFSRNNSLADAAMSSQYTNGHMPVMVRHLCSLPTIPTSQPIYYNNFKQLSSYSQYATARTYP